MKALILAAGLGTRLRPLTNDKPKALVEVAGQPLLHWAIQKVSRDGCREIVVNVHHFADQVIAFLEGRSYPGVKLHISDERNLLLDTGGAIKRALGHFGGQPFVVYNTDIFTDLNLADLYRHHQQMGGLATLAVRKRSSSRFLLFDQTMQFAGWQNIKTGEKRLSRTSGPYQEYAFSGIHVIDPGIQRFFPEPDRFSIIDVYLQAGRSAQLFGYDHTTTFWMDVGRTKDLETARTRIEDLPGPA